ncbi:restriction endonuclease subunit S [Caldovatus aquaticus]|uniref:Restriction endonuclease subunit S n=1 Tax=Caldovatus aquaticus TaxID=2865671 RepID=A0ABS7F409_9PROT|nr:restriction endonuclease subunit S [Caldovatus aquaticus]
MALGEVAEPVARPVAPRPDDTYRFIGVKWWGEGVYEFARKPGTETAASVLFRVEPDDLVINKIWARHGSIGVVPPDLAGAVGSNEFPTFRAKPERLLPRWLHWWSKSRSAWEACAGLSFGSSGKNRIKPAEFLCIPLPLPPLSEQERIVARLDAVEARLIARRRAAEAVEAELAQALATAFRRITADAPRARMGDVAPITRRPVSIQPDATYREIGARAFGRGLFEKPPLRGDSLTWQKLFEIQEGDLVISNIKAWEGAFAVAEASHHGTVGSHRYLTSVADPERAAPSFLCYYLQSPEGLAQVQAASPGSADRNRTLSQERFSAIEVPLPPLDAQRWFDRLQQKARAAREAAAAATGELDRLLPALLAEAFGP